MRPPSPPLPTRSLSLPMFPNGLRPVGKKKGFPARPDASGPKPTNHAPSTINQQQPAPKGFRKVGGRGTMPLSQSRTGSTQINGTDTDGDGY